MWTSASRISTMGISKCNRNPQPHGVEVPKEKSQELRWVCLHICGTLALWRLNQWSCETLVLVRRSIGYHFTCKICAICQLKVIAQFKLMLNYLVLNSKSLSPMLAWVRWKRQWRIARILAIEKTWWLLFSGTWPKISFIEMPMSKLSHDLKD